MIPIARPFIDADDVAAVVDVLRSGHLVQGAHVAHFEQACADLVGAAHAVAVSSGTAALHLALHALDVGPGDVVVVPAYSWPATANVVVLCGAEPLFVDIEQATFALAPSALDDALAKKPQVKAIIPVHPFGAMADMGAIEHRAAQHGIAVVEDAACALGAELKGRAAGRWGDVGCFSFHPRKSVTTGEGGVVTTSDATIAARVRTLRNHGQDSGSPVPDFVAAGFNYRMTDFQGALGTTQLAKLRTMTEARRERAEIYGQLLACTAVTPQATPPGSVHSLQSYVVLLPEGAGDKRPRVMATLRERGIETTVGTCHIPLTTYYRTRGRFSPGDFPVTDDVAARALTLPLFHDLTAQDQERVVRALVEILAD